jgi:multidrug efflux pump subunit AcrA (membrane-fusion protein)
LERKEQLSDKKFLSPAEVDKARAMVNSLVEQQKSAVAQVDVARANAGNAAAMVKQREAALSQARVDLERTAIRSPDGAKIGALSIIDNEPRHIADAELIYLRDLAAVVEDELHRRHLSTTQGEMIRELGEARRRSMVDPLTSVWNRAGLDSILERELAATAARRSAASADNGLAPGTAKPTASACSPDAASAFLAASTCARSAPTIGSSAAP